MDYGYIRVSSTDQNEDRQRIALHGKGVPGNRFRLCKCLPSGGRYRIFQKTPDLLNTRSGAFTGSLWGAGFFALCLFPSYKLYGTVPAIQIAENAMVLRNGQANFQRWHLP